MDGNAAGDLPPLNLATRDLTVGSSENLQLLPIPSGITGAHSSGEKSQTTPRCSSTNLSSPLCAKQSLLYTISARRV